jgi:hypothetical protein
MGKIVRSLLYFRFVNHSRRRGIVHLRSTQTPRERNWGLPHREKPKFSHIIFGTGVAAFSYYLLLQSFGPFLADAMTQLLSLGQIIVEKIGFEPPSLVLRLIDGSDLHIALTWQRSGLFSIIVFGLFFVFLVFSLEGPIWLKIIWLEFGNLAGLSWSFIRLPTLTLLAYHFGVNAFAVADFVTSPVVDFLWVIPVWSLGLSAVVSARRKIVASEKR